MARPLQDAVRELICKKHAAGEPCTVIAQELQIPYRTVVSVVALHRKTGRIASKKARAQKRTVVTAAVEDTIREVVGEDASSTLRQIQARISAVHNLHISTSTLHRATGDFSSLFKRTAPVPVQRNTESTHNIRLDYAHIIFLEDDEEETVYTDEMEICCSMRERRGRGPVATMRSRNFSVCAAVSRRGLLHFEVSDRPYNAERYGAFLSRLVGKLGSLGHANALLVMDNAPHHRTATNRSLMTSAGHRFMFFPPCTPGLNPVEEVFSKWRGLIRSRNCASTEGLLSAINTEHSQITVSHDSGGL